MIIATVFRLLAKNLGSYFVNHPTQFLIASIAVLAIIYKVEATNLLSLVFPKDLMNELSVDWELFLLELGGYFDPIGWSVSIDTDDEPDLSDEANLTREERFARERKRELIHRSEKAWLLELWKSAVGYAYSYWPILTILLVFYFAVEFMDMYIEFAKGQRPTSEGWFKEFISLRPTAGASKMYKSILWRAGVSLLVFMLVGVFVRVPYIGSAVLLLSGIGIILVLLLGTIKLLDTVNPGLRLEEKVSASGESLRQDAGDLIGAGNGWKLFIVMVSALAVYYLLPAKESSPSSASSTTLLEGPVYLDKEMVLGQGKKLYGDENKPAYWFSVAFQLWINPQPPSTGTSYASDAIILNMEGRPAVTYNNKSGQLLVSCLNAGRVKETIYSTTTLPLQRWNDIVINFSGGTVEVYVNGELGGTLPGIAPYMTRPLITIGQTDGIAGGIQNLSFRRDTVSPFTARLSSLLNNNFL